MKKQWKKLFVLVCMLAMGMMLGVSASAASKGSVSASAGVSASGASTIKCYLIGNSNVKVYSDSSFTRQCGTVFPSDEITLLSATSSYSWISYPISGGRTKKGYIRNSAIVTAVSGYVYTAKGKVLAYRRPNGAYYGYIAAGDRVLVLGTWGNYTQVRYPVSTGYKLAFVRTSDVNTWIKGKGNTQSPSSLSSPVPSGAKFSRKTWDGNGYWYHDINRGIYYGMPVYAIADGVVTYKQAYRSYSGTKYLTSYGNYIEFRSNDGVYAAKYCHLSAFRGASQWIPTSRSKRVSGSSGTYAIGSRSVRRGEVIGYIGTSGNSSGTHLHFELRKNGYRIDPTSVIGGLL